MNWTLQNVLSMAPDRQTADRGQQLATFRKWPALEGNERIIWGQCKSSGSRYYHSAVDLKGPAFKCNCPSRKFPCKHALGLMLMFVSHSDSFRITADIPKEFKEWLQKRDSKKEEKPLEVTAETIEKRAAQKAKNREKRLAQMRQGFLDLDVWLSDLIRYGLADLQKQPYTFWQEKSARMVDSKLGGLGRKVKALALIKGAENNWPEKMLEELTDLYLLTKGFKNLDELPAALQSELLSIAGINIKQEELLSKIGIQDNWLVLGQREGVDENLNFRRVWLYGAESKKMALLLDFSYGDAGFKSNYLNGSILKAEVVYYPSTFPTRAVLKNAQLINEAEIKLSGYDRIDHFAGAYADALQANPWLSSFPAMFIDVIPAIKNEQLVIIDEQKKYLPLHLRPESKWQLLAISGGNKISIFGEWTGECLLPLSAWDGSRLYDI